MCYTVIYKNLHQVIEMRKSGAVERRDDMIDLMIDAIKEEEKYRESIRRGENNNIVRFDNQSNCNYFYIKRQIELILTGLAPLMRMGSRGQLRK